MEVRQGRVGVDLKITPMTPPIFEVVVKLRVEASHEGKTAYLADMEYAAWRRSAMCRRTRSNRC